jgi:DNA-binding transcriptional LysR family regulator
MPAEVAERIVLPVLPELLDRYPGLHVALDLTVEVRDLVRQEADLAVRTVRPEQGDQLVLTRLRDSAYAVYGPRELRGDPDHLRRHAPWVRWGGGAGPIAAFYDTVTNVRLTTPALSAVRAACEAGVGLALLPTSLGACSARLAPIPFPDVPASTPLWLVGHAASRDVPRVRAVWTFLEEVFRPVPGRDEDAVLRERVSRAYGITFPAPR